MKTPYGTPSIALFAMVAVASLGCWSCSGSSSNSVSGATGGSSTDNATGGTSVSQSDSSTEQGGSSSPQGGGKATGGTKGATTSSTGGNKASGGATGHSSNTTATTATTNPTGGTPGSTGGATSAVGGTASSHSSTVGELGGITSTGGTTGIGGITSAGGGSSTAVGGSTHKQSTRPTADPASCGKSWALTDGVCCAQNCKSDNQSESCDKCGGPGSADCQIINSKACESGQWPEVHSVSDSEPWHYSRSTHFGITAAGACAFGLYGLCTTKYKGIANQCDAFCKAYPVLCQDPENITLHGNFAAPQGNYYTQFWPSLPGDNDNYLSCGECYELMRTKKDGTEYQPGEDGYTLPIVIQVVDSCPCAPNSKWCCGSGRDHCGEITDFAYGCPLPPSPTPPANHDPVAGESIHFDLSDIAMARLQSGSPDGAMPAGVIPTKYRRIPCPVPGNIYLWMQANASEYFISFSVVNMAGLGAAARVEAHAADGSWVALQRNSNYTMSRPQERYGTWATPQGAGPFQLPVDIRITDGGGRQVTGVGAIKAWAPSDASLKDMYYIDTGVQFTEH